MQTRSESMAATSSNSTDKKVDHRGELSVDDEQVRCLDEAPPIHRPGGGNRGSYRSVAFVERAESATDGQTSGITNPWLLSFVKFIMSNKVNFLLTVQVVLLLAVMSTLSLVATMAHGRGFGGPAVVCGGDGNETSCTITTNILPPLPQIDPDDMDAIALYQLSKKELFRVVKRAVRDVFLKPGNDSSVLQILARDLTVYLEARDHPEGGR